MGKQSTYPTLLDEVPQLRISKLKEWGYLKDNQIQSGLIKWSVSNIVINSINVKINTIIEGKYSVKLTYRYQNKNKEVIIQLVRKDSNLGRGFMYLFLCPITNKPCRKLYLVNGVFGHREAFKGCYYASQIRSKKYREMENIYGHIFEEENSYENLYKKHFKRYYAGKPTKRYKELLKTIKRGESVSLGDYERIFMC